LAALLRAGVPWEKWWRRGWEGRLRGEDGGLLDPVSIRVGYSGLEPPFRRKASDACAHQAGWRDEAKSVRGSRRCQAPRSTARSMSLAPIRDDGRARVSCISLVPLFSNLAMGRAGVRTSSTAGRGHLMTASLAQRASEGVDRLGLAPVDRQRGDYFLGGSRSEVESRSSIRLQAHRQAKRPAGGALGQPCGDSEASGRSALPGTAQALTRTPLHPAPGRSLARDKQNSYLRDPAHANRPVSSAAARHAWSEPGTLNNRSVSLGNRPQPLLRLAREGWRARGGTRSSPKWY